MDSTKAALQQAIAVAQSAASGARFGAREQVLLSTWAGFAPQTVAARHERDGPSREGCARAVSPAGVPPLLPGFATTTSCCWGLAEGEKRRAQAAADAAAGCSVAAAGLLRAMALPLSSAQYWREYHGSAAPAFLALLSAIVPHQPALNHQVVDIIAAALKALGNAKPDIARALLELAVAVLAAGDVMRMLAAGACPLRSAFQFSAVTSLSPERNVLLSSGAMTWSAVNTVSKGHETHETASSSGPSGQGEVECRGGKGTRDTTLHANVNVCSLLLFSSGEVGSGGRPLPCAPLHLLRSGRRLTPLLLAVCLGPHQACPEPVASLSAVPPVEQICSSNAFSLHLTLVFVPSAKEAGVGGEILRARYIEVAHT